MGVVSPRDLGKITRLTNNASEIIIYDPDTGLNYGMQASNFNPNMYGSNIILGPYDISTENATVTFPSNPIKGQRIYLKASGGDGTYKATCSTPSSELIDGLAASTWEIEGDGRMGCIFNGTGWDVEVYEDSGSNSNGFWKKHMDFTLECHAQVLETRTATGTVATPWTFPHVFASVPIDPLGTNIANIQATPITTVPSIVSVSFSGISTTGGTMYIDRSSTTATACSLDAFGKWLV